jgi:HAMP domain-containing protein
MDPTWLLVVLILIVLFASISIIGALRRIRDATEKTLAILETRATGENAGPSQ